MLGKDTGGGSGHKSSNSSLSSITHITEDQISSLFCSPLPLFHSTFTSEHFLLRGDCEVKIEHSVVCSHLKHGIKQDQVTFQLRWNLSDYLPRIISNTHLQLTYFTYFKGNPNLPPEGFKSRNFKYAPVGYLICIPFIGHKADQFCQTCISKALGREN